MDHSVAIYVLDKHARVRLMFTMNSWRDLWSSTASGQEAAHPRCQY
jgi:hypothetical protein